MPSVNLGCWLMLGNGTMYGGGIFKTLLCTWPWAKVRNQIVIGFVANKMH